MNTDLHICCSYMLEAYFLLMWPNKSPKGFFAASLQWDIYIFISENLFPSVCWAHRSFSHMLCLMDVLGMLITNKFFLVFFTNCALKGPLILVWSVVTLII